MKTKENTAKWMRTFLGLVLIIYALNQFFHFIPTGYGSMPENARNFIDGVAVYLPLLYIFEIVIGFFLIFNKWPSFILIVLFPLSVSFLIFNFANNDMSETWPALIVAGLNIALLLNEKEKYKPLFN
jgi:putative oxidoreductase